jgi:hypothetical protein
LSKPRSARSIHEFEPQSVPPLVSWYLAKVRHFDHFEIRGIMLRHLINAVAIVILFSATARAQVVAGDSPNAWNSAWAYGVSQTHDPGAAWRRQEEERKYQTVVKNIPNKKLSNDPWKNVRQAPTEADRHRVQ